MRSPAAVCLKSRFTGDCSSLTGELLDTVRKRPRGVPLCLSRILSFLLGVSSLPFVSGTDKGFTVTVLGPLFCRVGKSLRWSGDGW